LILVSKFFFSNIQSIVTKFQIVEVIFIIWIIITIVLFINTDDFSKIMLYIIFITTFSIFLYLKSSINTELKFIYEINDKNFSLNMMFFNDLLQIEFWLKFMEVIGVLLLIFNFIMVLINLIT
jgi:hypothetical protein